MGETLQTLMANLLNSFYPLVKPKHILDTLQNFPSAHNFLHGICELFLQDNLSYHHPVSRYYEILSNGSASHIKFLKWSFLFSWLIGSLIWPTHNQHNHKIINTFWPSIVPANTNMNPEPDERPRQNKECVYFHLGNGAMDQFLEAPSSLMTWCIKIRSGNCTAQTNKYLDFRARE